MKRSNELDFDQRIADWLEDDPNLAPRQAIETVLAAYPSIPQRRRIGQPRRFPTMTMPIRIATAAVIGVLAVGGAFYLTRPDQPAVGGPTPKPSGSQVASPPASPAANPSLPVVQPRAPAWIPTGEMTEARLGQTATLLPDGKVLVAGGGGIVPIGILPLASAELYDPGTGSWTATGDMASARDGHTATLLPDGKVLVTGGEDRNDERLSSAELYDPGSGSWTATEMMATSRRYHTATLLPDGKVLVAGGEDRNDRQSETSSAELYDPSNGSWTTTGTMIGTRAGHTATLLRDGKVLVAGGYRLGDSLVSAEVYDPGSGSWTATGNMVGDQAAQSAATHTATLLPDGTVLVAGSTRSLDSQPAFAAELYDPRSGAWSFTGPMDGVRFLHTATLLPDGTVLVAGGGTNRGGRADLPASAELYDPSTGSWAAAGNMITPHSGHTATLLLDGKVLVMGGSGGSAKSAGPASTSAELYDPGSAN